MIWGSICSDWIGPLVIWDKSWGKITSKAYVKHITEPAILWVGDDPLIAISYLLDARWGSSPSGQKYSRIWREKWELFDWNGQPPDLNPIEILWRNIKDKLDRVPVRPTTVTEMCLELQAMWENLNPQSWYIIVPTYILVSRLLLLQMVDTHNTSLTLGHYYIIIYLFFFIFLFSYHSCSSYGIASSAPSSVQSLTHTW